MVLDSNVQCTPVQFEQQWKLLLDSNKSIRNFKISTRRIPTMKECCNYFASKKIFSVASGANNEEESIYRIFVIGQTSTVPTVVGNGDVEGRNTVIRFFGELVIDSKEKLLNFKIKSNEPALVPSFIECLQLSTLFSGEYDV